MVRKRNVFENIRRLYFELWYYCYGYKYIIWRIIILISLFLKVYISRQEVRYSTKRIKLKEKNVYNEQL